MSSIMEISQGILRLSAADFQEFCDSFLSRRGDYGRVLGLGKQAGTAKTTIGNPDTYFRREDGKYVFVAYTTQQNNVYEKIKDDIEKCLDEEKTGVKRAEIYEIICCHTSSTLTAGQDFNLHNICEKHGISLSLFGVDEIAQEVCYRYPSLAKEYFDISIDTNQIMDVEEFINKYNNIKTAAPINTVLQHREKELSDLKTAIKNSNVVIIFGPAGYGKTRLALEAVKVVAKENKYQLLCIKSNNQGIYEDYVSRTEGKGPYLLFIDDANELSELGLIMDRMIGKKDTCQIKVVITVRDYVKKDVIEKVSAYVEPRLFGLTKLTDSEIEDFLRVNLGIKNEHYLKHIVRISSGNPRIAYMAGKLAINTKSLKSIHDISSVYENYYSKIVDQQLNADRELCVTAGLMSLLAVVNYSRIEDLGELLDSLSISERTFVNNIDLLSKMELVEVHNDRIAFFSDQSFANYMLYNFLFVNKAIPFSKLIYVGYQTINKGIIRATNLLMNLFLSDELKQYLFQEVRAIWPVIKSEKKEIFDDFSKSFHTFLPEESLLIASEQVDTLSEEATFDIINFNENIYFPEYGPLDYLSQFKYSEYLSTVVEIFAEYISKGKEEALIGFKWFKSNYGIDEKSLYDDFHADDEIGQLFCGLFNDSCTNSFRQFLIAYCQYALCFVFDYCESGNKNSIIFGRIEIKDTVGVKDYRSTIWSIVLKVLTRGYSEREGFVFLRSYIDSARGVEDAALLANDSYYIETLFRSLAIDDINKALLLRELNDIWDNRGVKGFFEEALFTSDEWHLYTLLENNYFRSGLDYYEYCDDRKERLCQFAETLSLDIIPTFIDDTFALQEKLNGKSKIDVTDSVGIIIDHLKSQFDLSICTLKVLMEKNIYYDLDIRGLLLQLFENMDVLEVWRFIDAEDYLAKSLWKYWFFQCLDEASVNNDIFSLLVQYFTDEVSIDHSSTACRSLNWLSKYMTCNDKVYVLVVSLLFKKRQHNENLIVSYLISLFRESDYSPKDLLKLFSSDLELLKKVYYYLLEKNSLFDLEGHYLAEFLAIDSSWLEEYACYLVKKTETEQMHDYSDSYCFKALWNTSDYCYYYDYIYRILSENVKYSWRAAEVLKSILSHEKTNDKIIERQKKWIEHLITEYAGDEKIVLLFDVLSEMDVSYRQIGVRTFIKNNSDYNLFEKLPLDPSSWGGSEEEIIPSIKKRIDYLKSLLADLSGKNYLKHRIRVRERIAFWESQIKKEEEELIVRHVYLG